MLVMVEGVPVCYGSSLLALLVCGMEAIGLGQEMRSGWSEGWMSLQPLISLGPYAVRIAHPRRLNHAIQVPAGL